MRVGVFIDISNLYHRVRAEFKNKIDYEKYLDFVKLMGEVPVAKAYGSCIGNSSDLFIKALTKIGYTPVFKKTKEYKDGEGNVDSIMIVDIMKDIDKFDKLVLGSADSDFLPVVHDYSMCSYHIS